MKYRTNYIYIKGFNLDTSSKPKPNSITYSKPEIKNGILISKGKPNGFR